MRYTIILLIAVLSLSFFSSCIEDKDAYIGRGLIINEFLASNDACCTDQSGDYDDWVELFNDSSDPIDIGGMYFTDTQKRVPYTPIHELYGDFECPIVDNIKNKLDWISIFA